MLTKVAGTLSTWQGPQGAKVVLAKMVLFRLELAKMVLFRLELAQMVLAKLSSDG